MLKLQFKDHRKAAIWLVDPRYAIGRDKSSDIVIDEEGVSGFHAELRVEDDDRVFLTDAGSINGTYVNGKQIKARTQLRANDVIRIHSVELLLVDPKEQLKAPVEDAATSLTPALQGLSVASSGAGVGGVPTGWVLRAKTGSLAGQAFAIPASGRAILGRSQNCDIIIPGTHVSRQHAELYFQSGKLHVKDLGSSNGTFVNRKKIDDSVVNPGDEVRFDTLVFQVEAPGGQAPAPDDAGDATQFRPAVSVATAAAKPAQPARPRPAAPVAAAPAAAPVKPSAPSAKASSPVGMIAVVVVLLAAGALAYWLLR
ncbi:MAG: FHA domain-containing protein [Alcanivoracaceae bacterium]|jgi:pSer/pThr/pTyr-binding forkhead associated (FHA) protein|nr:FHA domain-containing protein [Alcanivoracaceae bacterium]